jgi:hypothetical protein
MRGRRIAAVDQAVTRKADASEWPRRKRFLIHPGRVQLATGGEPQSRKRFAGGASPGRKSQAAKPAATDLRIGAGVEAGRHTLSQVPNLNSMFDIHFSATRGCCRLSRHRWPGLVAGLKISPSDRAPLELDRLADRLA